MSKKIKYLLLLSFAILLALCTKSEARITTNDPTVSSGGTATITISSQEKVASGAIDISSNDGLTFVSASGGQVNGTLVAFAGTDNKTSGIATYTFKAPNVTGTKTYKVVFTSKDMADVDGNEVADSSATATVTVKGSTTTNNNTSSGGTTNTTPAPSFTSVNETVYAKSEVNIRASYSTSSSILGSLQAGDSITRTGIGSNGWSKVTYNGQTAYISSDYLTKTKPEEPEDKEEEEKSNNKNLKTLIVTPTGLSPKFSSGITEYTMTVGSDIDEIKVDAVAEDSKAKVEIAGNEDLSIGNNIITIKVTAEDETVRTYKITVTKEEEEQIKLKELLVEGLPLQPEFDSNIYEYTLTLDKSDVSELNVTATPSESDATVEVVGSTELKPGTNLVTILVTASDGEIATYQITVNVPNAPEIETTNTDLYKYIAIGVAGAIIVIILLIIVCHRKSKDDVDAYDVASMYNIGTDKKQEELDSKESEETENKVNKNEENTNEEDISKIIEDSKEKVAVTTSGDNSEIDIGSLGDEELDSKRKKGKHF